MSTSQELQIVTRQQVVRFALACSVHLSGIDQRIQRLVFYHRKSGVVRPGNPGSCVGSLGLFCDCSTSCFFPGRSWTATRGQGGPRGLVGRATPHGFSQAPRLWAGWQATPWGKLSPVVASIGLGQCSGHAHWEFCLSAVLSSHAVRKHSWLWAGVPVAHGEPPGYT